MHVWLVAHPTKVKPKDDGTYPIPNPYDISGSAHWRNKADCCLSIWRDAGAVQNQVEVHVQKIRFREVGQVGMVTLTWDPATGRFSPGPSASPSMLRRECGVHRQDDDHEAYS